MDKEKSLKIYVVIVSYNGRQWLSECLESVKPYSVILVDNNSTDGTLDFVRTNFPEVSILEQKQNLGFGRANNLGILYALSNEADYVFLLNQDAKVSPSGIDKLLEIATKNPEYGILSPIHLKWNGVELEEMFSYYLKEEIVQELLPDFLLQRSIKTVYEIEMVNAAAWLISRKTLDTVGGFHPMFFLYGEDDNYCQRVRYHGFKIGICPEVFMFHDSNSQYHRLPERESEEYYHKFQNQIKVQFADVNRKDGKTPKNLRGKYFWEVVLNLLNRDWKKMRINLRKRKIVKNLDFSNDIEKGRKMNRTYLDN